MTTVTSSVPSFKAAFLSQLQARAGLVGVNVDWGEPINAEPEMIWLDATHLEEDSLVLGNSRRDERYTQDVVVRVLHGGDDNKAAEQRLMALGDEILSQLRTDPKVSNTVFWALPRSREILVLGDAQRVESRMTMQIEVRART